MTVKTTNFTSPEGEKLTVVFILGDDNQEIERYSFYNEPRELEINTELKTSIERLPELLQKIYNSGLKHEAIEFNSEDLLVN